MSRTPSLLGLPAELRTMVYSHYVTTEGGYLFNIESGKLLTADGRLIDFSLMYACTQISREMQGLALKHNSITFAETYSEKLSILALNHQLLLSDLYICQWEMFLTVGPCINDDMRQKIVQEFPDYISVLDCITDVTMDSREVQEPHLRWRTSWGQSFSSSRRFVARVLQLASTHPEFVDTVTPRSNHFKPLRILEWSHLTTAPWIIPTKEMLAQIPQALWGGPLETNTRSRKCRFSTASVAIRFLSSMPLTIRLQVRRIILREDSSTMGYSECHPFGLIPFCQENPRLRIESRLNLWSSILRSIPWTNETWALPREGERRIVAPKSVYASIQKYVLETVTLTQAGMPGGSFTLMLDGEPALEKCTEVFERSFHPTMAREIIVEKLRSAQNSSKACRHHRIFPQAISDIVDGKSIIYCNFFIGQMLDIDKLMKIHPSWTIEDWVNGKIPLSKDEIFWWQGDQPKWLDLFPQDLDIDS